jgi:threonine/homoserine/homoserine lactone efflux protein
VPDTHTLIAFAAVAAVFVAIPGPSNLFVVARGLQSGPRAAIAGAVGCATGALTYVVATAAGLSALLASSQVAFAALHYGGAAYLCWLGLSALRAPERRASHGRGPRSPWRSYRQGLVVELANPKVALFFLALFPQFIHTGAGSAELQILTLGALFVGLGLLSDCAYALGAGRLGRGLVVRPEAERRRRRVTGALYLGLGGWAAASGTR